MCKLSGVLLLLLSTQASIWCMWASMQAQSGAEGRRHEHFGSLDWLWAAPLHTNGLLMHDVIRSMLPMLPTAIPGAVKLIVLPSRPTGTAETIGTARGARGGRSWPSLQPVDKTGPIVSP